MVAASCGSMVAPLCVSLQVSSVTIAFTVSANKTINISLLVPIRRQTYIRTYVHRCIRIYVHTYTRTDIQSFEAKYASFMNNRHSMVSFSNEKIWSANHGWAVNPTTPKLFWDWLGGNLDSKLFD